ncbi:CHAT domain-containing protein [Amycolatopsis sp. WQ 127309]|uniref:CHAT domain-containing protein n=1 Tax=Amycolatopsis sp. WQ 127309 TaxID=2932773 RepID=UPI001FF42EA5|nr:CHAT domain-containing protein [Amycolatopsis sp. WQ 127309]UOZ11348.1 CHAT domain-containing protein [Amycolatopsis sp. WQ 127309]
MSRAGDLHARLAGVLAAWDQATGDRRLFDAEDMVAELLAAARLESPDNLASPRVLRAVADWHLRCGMMLDAEGDNLRYQYWLAILAAVAGHDPSLVPENKLAVLAPDLDPLFPRSWSASDRGELVNAAHTAARIMPESVERVIELLRQALGTVPEGHPDRPEFQYMLGMGLLDRYRFRSHQNDLDEAIARFAESAGTPQGRPHHSQRLVVLASTMRERAQLRRSRAEYDDAVHAARTAFAATHPGGPGHTAALAMLGGILFSRYLVTHLDQDLNESVTTLRHAVQLPHDLFVVLPSTQITLGNALLSQWMRDGDLALLNDVVAVFRSAVAGSPAGSPEFARSQQALAMALSYRFDQYGQLEDVTEAIDLTAKAVRAMPTGHPEYATNLAHLAGYRLLRHGVTQDTLDLDEALVEISAAAASDQPMDREAVLLGLASVSKTRYQRTADPADLLQAIASTHQALDLYPPDHTDRAAAVGNLGAAYHLRHQLSTDPRDLDTAIDLLRESIQDSATAGDRAQRLVNLSIARFDRYELTGDPADARLAAATARDAHALSAAPPHLRLDAANRWGRYEIAVSGDPATGLPGLAAAVELLPRVAWRGVDQNTRERVLGDWQTLTGRAVAAAIAAGEPATAVELFELGRGVLWSQLLETRTDLSLLSDVAPELARRLEDVGTALDRDDQAGTEPFPSDARVTWASEWDDLVGRVRSIPGFESFLTAAAFAELRTAAQAGPVVLINVSAWRCDALVLHSGLDEPQVVPLPELTLGETTLRGEKHASLLRSLGEVGDRDGRADLQVAMSETLRWMWDTIAEPVLTELDRPDRIWWCPSGLLTFLPLHAAGNETDSVLDLVVSSYTPTVQALCRAIGATDPAPDRRSLLVVATPRTPGARTVPGVGRTRARLERLFPRHTTIPPEYATRATVLAQLAGHAWVHFGCHGAQDLDAPYQGGLVLLDDRLTVADLTRTPSAANAEFAFLGACETAVGGSKLPEEAINLAAGMQFAGYRHVIGTLWSVADTATVRVARDVYDALARDGELDAAGSAKALHAAVRALRNRHPGTPSMWAPYLHVGP